MQSHPPEQATGIVARALVRLLRDGVTVEFVAQGGSMWPTIRGGALVRVRPCAEANLRLGDVAAYESAKGSIVVHRVVGRSTDGCVIFQGDAHTVPDVPVPSSAILGVGSVLRQRRLTIRVPTIVELALVFRAAVSTVRRTVARSLR